MSKRDDSKLLNYTTEIDAMKTAGEIIGILATNGAQSVMIDYQDGEPVGLAFQIGINGRNIGFRLPCNIQGAFDAMKRDHQIPPRYKNLLQAKRTAWRILKTFVEVQIALIKCGQVEMAEAFFAYMIVSPRQTLFQAFKENPARMLSAGTLEDDQSNVVEGKFAS